jgi:hypothetical protein
VSSLKLQLLSVLDLFVLKSQDPPSGSQTSIEFILIEGLGEIIIGSCCQAPDEILLIILCGEKHNVLVGRAVPLPDQSTKLHAIRFRHHPIEDE